MWTVYDYDELGRVKTVTHPPNTGTSGNSGVTTYVYELNTVKVTDPAVDGRSMRWMGLAIW